MESPDEIKAKGKPANSSLPSIGQLKDGGLDSRTCNIFYFSDTWLLVKICPMAKSRDSHRADRTFDSGKSRGGGASSSTAKDVLTLAQWKSSLFWNIRLPPEISAVIVTCTYSNSGTTRWHLLTDCTKL
jgi:hypothetical protein